MVGAEIPAVTVRWLGTRVTMDDAERSSIVGKMLRDMEPIDPSEGLARIRALIQTVPNFSARQANDLSTPQVLKWMGDVGAVVRATRIIAFEVAIDSALRQLARSRDDRALEGVLVVLHRVMAELELKVPASQQGSFIAAGGKLDGYAAISRVLGSAQKCLLVVDPYMDGVALTDFFPSAKEGIALSLLVDEADVKPTLEPAAKHWYKQFGDDRPLEIRLAQSRSLHDRLIIVDQETAWSLTQSFKDFANRAHGSILKADPETTALKIEAYTAMWNNARPL